MTKHFIALDIGTDSIKFVYGKRNGTNFIVERADALKMSADTYTDGKIINHDKMAFMIQELLAKNKVNTKNVIMTFNSSNVIVRELIIPSIKSKELDTIVRYEIMQMLPIELEQYILEYVVIGELVEENIKKDRILVSAVPRNTAEAFYLLLEELKLHPSGLLINPLCLFNILDMNGITINNSKMSSESFAILDIGHSSLDVNIFTEEKLTFSRRLTQGIGNLDSMISISRMMSLTDARKLREGLNTYFDIEVKSEISKWAADIQRAIAFNDARTNKPVKRLFICGGGSEMNGITRVIGEALGIETEIIQYASNIKFKKNTTPSLALYITAIGSLPSKK